MLGTRLAPRIIIVCTVNGSVLATRFVTLYTFARPPGPGTAENVNMSGLAGMIVMVVLKTVPLTLITIGYLIEPSAADVNAGGSTNSIVVGETDFMPQPTPLIVTVTPLSSSGKFGDLVSDPTAVLGVIACGDANVAAASIPDDRPTTDVGVTGVGVTDGEGVGVGVGVGVTVGEGVGVGVAETGSRLAPVANETAVIDSCKAAGVTT